MTLWFIFALMTAAAAFAVLWPLGRKPGAGSGGSDRVVYADQLHEIDRDRAAGLIGEAEAEAARVEISRRLLAAADAETSAPAAPSAQQFAVRHRAAAIAAVIILPVIGLGFYLTLGSPEIPGRACLCPCRHADRRAVHRESRQPGRGASRQQSQGWRRLGGDRAGLYAAWPLRRRGRRVAQDARAQRRQRDARSPISARRRSPPRTAW